VASETYSGRDLIAVAHGGNGGTIRAAGAGARPRPRTRARLHDRELLVYPHQPDRRPKLVDVSDVVETQKEEYTETALLNTYCYNNITKQRSFYGVPFTTATLPNHVWRPLVEKAGYKIEDIPKTWDAYYDFFKEVQKKLRAQGVRNVYGLGVERDYKRQRSQQRLQLFPDRLWRPGHRDQGREIASR
jgi:hypothetical protein